MRRSEVPGELLAGECVDSDRASRGAAQLSEGTIEVLRNGPVSLCRSFRNTLDAKRQRWRADPVQQAARIVRCRDVVENPTSPHQPNTSQRPKLCLKRAVVGVMG